MSNNISTNIRTLLTSVAAFAVLQAASAAPLPDDFTVTYDFSRNSLNVGKVIRRLHKADDGMYVFESVSEATGFIALFVRDEILERSKWIYAHDRPKPLQYVYKREGGKKERHVKLSFDWEDGIVTNTINNDPWQMDIPPETQDKLLYQLTMMIDLQAGKKTLRYDIADGGILKEYEFAVLGEERIETPVGRLETVKLKRIGDERHTTIWCARKLDYLPVRIEQQEKDDSRLAMLIREVKGFSAAATKTSTSDSSVPE